MASLLDLVEALVRDPAAKAAYRADPDEFLGSHGFGGLEPADLEEALHQAADSFPPTLAAQVDPTQGFDSLVPVDLQELGFDDELRPFDPLDAGPEPADWHGPALGEDVDFDAPAGQPAADADGDDVDDAVVATAAAGAELDDDLDGSGRAGDGGDGLSPDAIVDQPAAAAWADDPFDRPGLGPDSDDPWFYNQDQPTFVAPDDVDDDILDDVDDFHHDS